MYNFLKHVYCLGKEILGLFQQTNFDVKLYGIFFSFPLCRVLLIYLCLKNHEGQVFLLFPFKLEGSIELMPSWNPSPIQADKEFKVLCILIRKEERPIKHIQTYLLTSTGWSNLFTILRGMELGDLVDPQHSIPTSLEQLPLQRTLDFVIFICDRARNCGKYSWKKQLTSKIFLLQNHSKFTL